MAVLRQVTKHGVALILLCLCAISQSAAQKKITISDYQILNFSRDGGYFKKKVFELDGLSYWLRYDPRRCEDGYYVVVAVPSDPRISPQANANMVGKAIEAMPAIASRIKAALQSYRCADEPVLHLWFVDRGDFWILNASIESPSFENIVTENGPSSIRSLIAESTLNKYRKADSSLTEAEARQREAADYSLNNMPFAPYREHDCEKARSTPRSEKEPNDRDLCEALAELRTSFYKRPTWQRYVDEVPVRSACSVDKKWRDAVVCSFDIAWLVGAPLGGYIEKSARVTSDEEAAAQQVGRVFMFDKVAKRWVVHAGYAEHHLAAMYKAREKAHELQQERDRTTEREQKQRSAEDRRRFDKYREDSTDHTICEFYAGAGNCGGAPSPW